MPGHVGKGRISGMMKQDTFMALTSAGFASGWKGIGAAFGVSSRIVRSWADEGAPVVMATPSTPCICLDELWEWLKGRGRTQPPSLPEKVSPRGPERMTGFCYLFFPIFPLRVGNVGKEKSSYLTFSDKSVLLQDNFPCPLASLFSIPCCNASRDPVPRRACRC